MKITLNLLLSTRIGFKQVLFSEAHTKIGYSPLITFNVPHFDTIMERLKNYSVEFDGEPNTNSTVGKVYKNFSLRSLALNLQMA